MNPWQLYDDLIEGIPEGICVSSCNTGYNWTTVRTDDNTIGLAMTIPVISMPATYMQSISGMPLIKAAALVKSWNFVEAALGVAAIGAYYNRSDRVQHCGIEHPGVSEGNRDAFDVYQQEVSGKQVTVVGHFPELEKRFGPICNLTILERKPQWGDMPDTACEYILGEQDYVFITGSTLVNKTLPRLLKLSENAKIILVGPSTIMSPKFFNYGVFGLSGFVAKDAALCEQIVREGNTMKLFETGVVVDRAKSDH